MNTRLPRFVAALISSAALLTVAVPAHAVLINFDDTTAPALFSDAQPLTSAGGVTFSGTGAVLNEDSDFMVTGYSGLNFLAYNSEAFIGPLANDVMSQAFDVFTFSTPLSAFSFMVGSGLTGPPPSVGRMVEARAFSGNMLLDMRTITLTSALQTVFLRGPGITRVTLTGNVGMDDEGIGFVVDNLDTAPAGNNVPEPASLVLLGSALAGMFVSRRRAAARR